MTKKSKNPVRGQRTRDERPTRRTSDTRKRTLERLQKLLLTGAAVGLSAIEACDCTQVCDPLPPPLECAKNPTTSDIFFSQRLSAQASWILDSSDLLAEVLLVTHKFSGENSLTFTANPQLTGATLGYTNREETSLTFRCTPSVGVTEVDVVVPLDCDGITESLQFQLDLSAEPKEGESIPLSPLE